MARTLSDLVVKWKREAAKEKGEGGQRSGRCARELEDALGPPCDCVLCRPRGRGREPKRFNRCGEDIHG